MIISIKMHKAFRVSGSLLKCRVSFPVTVLAYGRAAFCSRAHSCVSTDLGHSEEEVERKFVVTAAVVAAVDKLTSGAPDVAHMLDIYFDNAEYKLSMNDMWLRRRNKGFELKWPQTRIMAGGDEAGLSGIDFYNETTSWSQIADQLQRIGELELVGERPPEGEKGEPAFAWLQSNGLNPFAAIHTTRRRYKLLLPVSGSSLTASAAVDPAFCHAVNVDLDDVRYDLSVGVEDRDGILGTGTGPASVAAAAASPAGTVPSGTYSLGEVELVRAGGGMPAPQAMAEVFASLGIGHESVRGKVLEWLVRFRPSHYAALERCGLIASKMQ